MTNVVTYVSSSWEVDPSRRWLAYVVLPDGSLWGVRFEGETEEIASRKAIVRYESEKTRLHVGETDDEQIGVPSGRGSHLIGTVCMINHSLKQRIRCAAAEVEKFEAKGWVKGGPRTPFME